MTQSTRTLSRNTIFRIQDSARVLELESLYSVEIRGCTRRALDLEKSERPARNFGNRRFRRGPSSGRVAKRRETQSATSWQPKTKLRRAPVAGNASRGYP